MASLIVYESRHGCTAKCAEKLKELLNGDVDMTKVKKLNYSELDRYDAVIIGGSIHAGSVQRSIASFCKKNIDLLKTKSVGLFLCCMEDGEKGEAQFQKAFPDELKSISKVDGLFGGAFYFGRMNFLERAIIKKISGITEDVEKIKFDEIKHFADVMNS